MKRYDVGFMCGFFDILHKGHIDSFKFAKQYCNHLIVAVGTDEFMISRKNRESVLSYEQRKSIVEAIKYVDEVIAEQDLDKIKAYHQLHFDVMFAGEDHKNENVYVKAESDLRKYGVDTIYIPRNYVMSSTVLRKRAYEIENNIRQGTV